MENIIETPKISEILLKEFMQPLSISAYRLAKDINVPVSRIQDILKDKPKSLLIHRCDWQNILM